MKRIIQPSFNSIAADIFWWHREDARKKIKIQRANSLLGGTQFFGSSSVELLKVPSDPLSFHQLYVTPLCHLERHKSFSLPSAPSKTHSVQSKELRWVFMLCFMLHFHPTEIRAIEPDRNIISSFCVCLCWEDDNDLWETIKISQCIMYQEKLWQIPESISLIHGCTQYKKVQNLL